METNQDKHNDQTIWSKLAIPTGDILLEVRQELKEEQEAKQKEKASFENRVG